MINLLPKRLKSLRKKYGYSQKQVADKLRLSPSIISAYETGERTPSTEILLSISYLYNCSVDYLLGKRMTEPKVIIDTSGLSDEQINAINYLIKTIREKQID